MAYIAWLTEKHAYYCVNIWTAYVTVKLFKNYENSVPPQKNKIFLIKIKNPKVKHLVTH